MSEIYVCPPLEEGARVVTDVIPASVIDRVDIIGTIRDIVEPGERADLVLVAVPAGEGVAVEAAVRRALRVEA